MKIITFPLELAYIGFKPTQPYLDTTLLTPSCTKIGTLIEYQPGEYALVAGLRLNEFPVRKLEDIRFNAIHNSQKIELEPIIICARTNLTLLKPKRPEELKAFHSQAVKLASQFVLNDGDKVNIFQLDLMSLKNIATKVKAKRFRFDRAFCFSLSQKIEEEFGLSSPGPLLDAEENLVGYMINPTDKYVISVFHIHYLLEQRLHQDGLQAYYPLIDLELLDLVSTNYALYLPDEVVDKASGSFGCSIQNCPTYSDYPLKRGDILLAIDGHKIVHQHIEMPPFGKINIEAAPLITKNKTVIFTLYRQGEKLDIEIDKRFFSEPYSPIKSHAKFIIMNGVVYQAANHPLYRDLGVRGDKGDHAYLHPTNNHNLSKAYRYLKQKNEDVVLITETLTNTTLFNAGGSPFNTSAQMPFVLKKINGIRVTSLEMLIRLMKSIDEGSHYDLEGAMNDQVIMGYGIKISENENTQILQSRNITRSYSDNFSFVEEGIESLDLKEKVLSIQPYQTSANCLYHYHRVISTTTNIPMPTQQSGSQDFSIQKAAMQGMLFIHATTKHRNPLQPDQYTVDTRGVGSGFIVRHKDKNYVVTCAHVAGYTTESLMKANFPGQSKDFELNILMINNDQDIAILEVSAELQKEFDKMAYPFYIDNSSLFPKKQSDILVIGFPSISAGDKTNPKIQPGKVTTIGYINLQGYARSHSALAIQVNAATSGGNSGGPVIDAKTGAVISIHSNGATTAQLSNFSRPAHFLAKMLKKLEKKETYYPCYPTLPGIPFELVSITDRRLKVAHGIEADSPIGAKISALYGNIPELEIGDILLSLIDKNGIVYPVDGKGTISIEDNDIACRVFFELHEIDDLFSIEVLRKGKERLIQLKIDESWPLFPQICGPRKDCNQIPHVEFCQKLIISNFDVGTTQAISSKLSLMHYASKLQKQERSKSNKVVILEILPDAYDELSPWILKRSQNELLFINKINNLPIHSIEDVQKIASDKSITLFELECKSTKCVSKDEKFIFRITRQDIAYELKRMHISKQ